MVQRAIAIRAPYGTAFIHQTDGSIWLYYDDGHCSTETVVSHFRDLILTHQEEVLAHKLHTERVQQAQSVAAPVIPSLVPPTTVVPPVPVVHMNHDWGGPYRLGISCKRCGQTASGQEKRCFNPPPIEDTIPSLAVPEPEDTIPSPAVSELEDTIPPPAPTEPVEGS